MSYRRSMTITEKILAEHAGIESTISGQNIWVDIDYLMTHDVFGPEVIRIFEEKFGEQARIWDPGKLVLIPDHYIFTDDSFANRNLAFLNVFAAKHNLEHYFPPHTDHYSGVCHVTLAEKGFNLPGGLLLGTDSHTCTSGAFGMFSTGIGNTEAAFVMGKGRLWLKVPQSIKVRFDGPMPAYLMAKDLILHLIGDIGVDGATYKTLEFCGSTIEAISIEERMTLCNMAVEAGAKNGIIAADEKTLDYIAPRAKGPFKCVSSDDDAEYFLVKRYNTSTMAPTVARPHSPDNRAKASELDAIALDRAYVGSCTGGKIEDLTAAASLLYGRRVAIDTFIVPATTGIEAALRTTTFRDKTLFEIFAEAGCKIGKPSCAACVGGPIDTFGRTQGVETVISSTNRNFPGRMGSGKSNIYLASPFTVIASALTGKITDPRTIMEKQSWE
ncbi:MAG: 3-isopropylmalate/(R)-2-methylmalate dehydratase large subunit [Candidatus Kentron sp. G]|nr:MAG: 3-isopropylmalate/(R)-2-methylmalate dehydratase large subunit [Candidatus Kentron sp. G]VFM97962.1 MAG: 3-isopropylmalate/(R)-2-methylmalate dehydratase large subunit [Candidatus Kentron sp. G]VFM99319.1 MAG: 3-isopropylmalate/(R)-2-methylmalate dehydratase large subunit [Candidatus Kentron sp. G]